MKKIITGICSLLMFLSVYAQNSVTGFVYEDANGNNKKDRREKGIAGVGVSNGVAVTTTGNNGAYTLPLEDDNIIFVIKPSGFKPALNKKNQPVFYHIHKPNGSPENYKYKGVSPTGVLPESLDFALVKSDETNSFSALIFGDPQPYNMEELNHFSKGIVDEVEGISGMQFGLSLGDLVGDDLSLHSPYIDAVQKVGIPWYNLMGNHDMNYEALADSLSDESFEAAFGPANYSFNYGNAHFIVLDDILYPDPRDNKGYWAGFRQDQLDFIENDLALVDTGKLVVLAFHIPLKNSEANYRYKDRQQLFDLLSPYPHTLSLSAHTHLQRNDLFTEKDGWKGSNPHHEYNAGTTSGDWYSGELNENGVPVSTMRDGTPKGYAFLHVDGNSYSIQYKVAGKPADYQVELYAPKVVPAGSRTSAGIYANFFMGREDSKVEFRIDNNGWQRMNYVVDADPAFMSNLHKWDHIDKMIPGRRPSNPENSTHLWRAGFPNPLSAGPHTIEVRATDMFGKVHTATKTFIAEAPVK